MVTNAASDRGGQVDHQQELFLLAQRAWQDAIDAFVLQRQRVVDDLSRDGVAGQGTAIDQLRAWFTRILDRLAGRTEQDIARNPMRQDQLLYGQQFAVALAQLRDCLMREPRVPRSAAERDIILDTLRAFERQYHDDPTMRAALLHLPRGLGDDGTAQHPVIASFVNMVDERQIQQRYPLQGPSRQARWASEHPDWYSAADYAVRDLAQASARAVCVRSREALNQALTRVQELQKRSVTLSRWWHDESFASTLENMVRATVQTMEASLLPRSRGANEPLDSLIEQAVQTTMKNHREDNDGAAGLTLDKLQDMISRTAWDVYDRAYGVPPLRHLIDAAAQQSVAAPPRPETLPVVPGQVQAASSGQTPDLAPGPYSFVNADSQTNERIAASVEAVIGAGWQAQTVEPRSETNQRTPSGREETQQRKERSFASSTEPER